MKCSNCPNEVDLRADWTLAEVTGWEKQRKGGGLNHLHFPQRTGRFLCAECVMKRKYTGEQLSIG